jgi:two-component system nitrogen regulation sensor histidine kinase NtrY
VLFFQEFLKKHTNKLIFGLIILFLVFGYFTYPILANFGKTAKSHTLFCLLYIDIALLLSLTALISRNVVRIIKRNYRRRISSKFHNQVIVLFSLVTIIPAACTFVFALIFFNTGIESLFKTPIKSTIDNANQVSSVYINEKEIAMANFAAGLGKRIKDCINVFSIRQDKIEMILYEETNKLKIDALVIQAIEGKKTITLARTAFSIALEFEDIPDNVTYLKNGKVVSWESDDSIVTAQMIDENLGIYLIASSKIDKKILSHRHTIKNAILEYANLAIERTNLKITFITFFFGLTVLLFAISILTGLIFANWIITPVNKLIWALKSISAGNYNSPISVRKFNNEWDLLISAFNNMAEQLEYQKRQLIISNKQSAWQDIARKIAHEIKNPLTPIQLSAERLKRKYENEISSNTEIFNSCIDTIIRQVHCIRTLVNEFSDFARMPEPSIERADIIKLLKEAVFIQATAHKNIAFRQSYYVEVFMCNIDQVQINQVMMNILQNSINAIVENNQNNSGGFIGNIIVNFSVNQRYFRLIIEDDGPGFSDNALKNAFEPYYTTRKSGSGLGLAIAYKIIKEHGGNIELGKSEVLKGALTIIEIPYYS